MKLTPIFNKALAAIISGLGKRLFVTAFALVLSGSMACAAPKAFVANSSDNTVSVISLKPRTVISTIGVGSSPRHLVASPDGGRVYVTNYSSNSVSVIDAASMSVVTTVPVGTNPLRLAVSRNGKRIYVVNSGSANISVIDRLTNTVVATIATPSNPTAIAFHPVRDEFWVGFGSTGVVLRAYSAVDHSVLASLTSFTRLYGTDLVFKADGSELFASESCGFCGRFHRLSGTLSGGTMTILQNDILSDNTGSANGIAINPVTGVAYLAKQGQNGTPKLYEFPGLARSLNFTDPPLTMASTEDGTSLYVVNDKTAGTVSVVDTQTLTKSATINVGGNPQGIVIVEDAPKAFVANSADNTVSAISLKSRKVVGTITVGNSPRYLAASLNGDRVYVTNFSSNSVSVIDIASMTVIATVPVGTNPLRLAVSRNGLRVYVTNSGSSNISVIDTPTNTVASTIGTPPNPAAIAFHPVRDEFWVGFGVQGIVLQAYSATNNAVLGTLSSSNRLYGTDLVFKPDGSELFASESCGFCGRFHRLSGTISGGAITVIQGDILFDNTGSANGVALNPVTGVAYLAKQGQNGTPRLYEFGGLSRSLNFTDPPLSLATTGDGALLYIVNDTTSGIVSVVDTQTLTKIGTINVGGNPQGIVIVEDVPKAFVANSTSNNVSVISLKTRAVIGTIPVGHSPRNLAASPDGGRVYVTNYNSNSISVIETSSMSVVATVPVGSNPLRVAVSRDGKRVYAANSGSASISVIDRITNAVVATIATPPNPTTIAFHPVRDEFWVGFGVQGIVMQAYSATSNAVLGSLSSSDRLYGTVLVFRPDGSELIASESCGFCGRFHRLAGNLSGGAITVIQNDILYDNTGSANGVALNPITGVTYFAKQGQNGTPRLYEFGGSDRALDFTDPPLSLATTEDGALLYVVNDTSSGIVSVVDTQTLTRIATINVGGNPQGIVIAQTSGRPTFTGLFPTLAPGADANSNGAGNFLDYASGYDPTAAPDGSVRSRLFVQGGDTFFQYSHRTNAADLYSGLQKSTDLLNWLPAQFGTDYIVEDTSIPAPNRMQITLRLFSTGGTGQYWRRLFSTAP